MQRPLHNLRSVPESLRSVPAAIGRLRAQHKSFAETAFRTAGMVAGFLVPFGIGAAVMYGFDRMANRTKAHSEKKALADWYAPQVAKQLGIDPARVSVRDLELAASVNPAIAKVVENVEKEQSSANAMSGAAAVAGGIASTLIPVAPGAGLVGKAIPGVMAMAGGVGGSVAAGWLTSPDALKNPQVILENLEAMRDQGQPVAPIHTFMLRVAQNTELQRAIKQQAGTEYYNLSAEQQAMVMSAFPRVAAYAEKDARFLANGGQAQELMFIQPEGKQWTQRVNAQATAAQAQR